MDTSAFRYRVGLEIRKQREARNLSMDKLGSMISTNKAQIWRIENGTISTGIDTIYRIANALDVPPYTFFLPPGAYVEYRGEDGEPD